VIALHTVVVAAQAQISSDLGDETVILNLKNGMYFGLDQVGTRIWKLIQQPQSVTTLCNTLIAEYDVTAAQCELDVVALLWELATAELIECVDAAAA